MKTILNRNEINIVKKFLKVHIPDYIKHFSVSGFDLMDCYEVGFVFANDLLRNKEINPDFSPWGDGNSVIFDSNYSQLLINLLKQNINDEVNDYCRVYLDLLDIFKSHFIV